MYSDEQVNAALQRVDAAKREKPTGFAFLDDLQLDPSPSYVVYILGVAEHHAERLAGEPKVDVYASGWLNGLAVGHELGREAISELVALLRECGPSVNPSEWHRVMAKYDPGYAGSDRGRAHRALGGRP